MAGRADTSFAYRAPVDLLFKGKQQPSGYTEPLLHAWLQSVKAAQTQEQVQPQPA